ncbi:MAG: S-methyl-5-thioribose-1-phosphate isomerase [Candidatus Thermoplasmatota archaeon]
MKINGENKKALWFQDDIVHFIDQRKLPYNIQIFKAENVEKVSFAIKEMVVRGAPAIGAAAAYGMVLGCKNLEETAEKLRKTRPTAYDLFYAIEYMLNKIETGEDPVESANQYVEDIIERCRKIGENGEKIIEDNSKILTHCNAGALATVDYGTALSPIRIAHEKGKKIFVYVDETRPRCQGLLTDWELTQEGIPHTYIVDNAAGYYMEKGEIDMVITGADRIAENGDFANKIGTYEKAVLAKENNIPFYVAAPISTFDKSIGNGEMIEIEERDKKEITHINKKRFVPNSSDVKNPAFDVTPNRFVTGFITEKGFKRI